MMYLIDTDTLIFLIRGMKIVAPHTAREKELRYRAEGIFRRCQRATEAGDAVAVSAITVAELEFGARRSGNYDREIAAVQKILSPFVILDFDGRECAREYGKVRSTLENAGIPIGAMDLLIAAHAKAVGAVLVTNNLAHFSRVDGLTVENWI